LAVGVLGSFAAAALDAATTAAARDALLQLAAGDARLDERKLSGLATFAGVALGLPLALLGLLLLIELQAGPREREPKNYAVVWLVQSAFLAFALPLEFASIKLGLLPSEPLFRFETPAGTMAQLVQTVPLFVLALLISDFFRYWFHRAQHHFAFLWRFHAVHHSPRDLDVLHDFTHPFEQIGNLFLIAIPTAFLIGVDLGQLYLVGAFFAVQGRLHHMNVPVHYGPLRHILCDNRYHFVHHSRDPADYDSNFAGLFPVLDRLFGTYREPKPGPLPATGLPGPPPTRLSHYLLARWPDAETPSGAPEHSPPVLAAQR
jgi:sterol desaturase/sphingolipid hydroxylase (fatty acid hydroxylase superfamily)